MRAFLALPLPDTICDALERLQESIPGGNLIPPENFHLTLAFLGEQPEHALEDLHFSLEAFRATAFGVHLKGLDTFGTPDPTNLHIAAEPSPALLDLHKRLKSALHGAGIELERTRFRPHVTLARFTKGLTPEDAIKLGRFLQARANTVFDPFTVTEFTLYESIQTKHGSVYEPLASYPLAPN